MKAKKKSVTESIHTLVKTHLLNSKPTNKGNA
jgi:hypothetical protein